MGSKRRIAKEIIPIILKDLHTDQWYVEPFVGGCNLIDKVDHQYKIGADNNTYLIAMWKALQNGWIPPTQLSKEEYMNIKDDYKTQGGIYPDYLIGYVGFNCSFRSKWWGGYNGNDLTRDYMGQTNRSTMKQVPFIFIKDIVFYNDGYETLVIPDKSIIYCDPPYANTTKYGKVEFDSDRFWQWCREKATEGHKVFISEYNAPEDFICIWQKEISSNLGATKKTATEKLFIHKTQQ